MLQLTDDELLNELRSRFDENKKALSELNRLNRILTKVNDKLSEAEAMKSHFISNISNEIINPFTSIIGLSQTILESYSSIPEEVIKMVSLIHGEAFNLDFQFRNIFAAAKIEAGEISMEVSKADISAIINDIIESYRFEARHKLLVFNKTFEKQSRKSVDFKTDVEKISIIIDNLINNAVKFSNKGGFIDIGYSINNGVLVVTIADHGKGIDTEHYEEIFDRFKKLDLNISSINRGHGLGLSIVKAYTEFMNGSVNVESTSGKGTQFILTIPESDGEVNGFCSNGYEVFIDKDIN